jgi:hypothetical protein
VARKHVARKAHQFDLYYIENWSLSLDFRLWLTVLRGVNGGLRKCRGMRIVIPERGIHRVPLVRAASRSGHSVIGIDNLLTGDLATSRMSGRDFVFVRAT